MPKQDCTKGKWRSLSLHKGVCITFRLCPDLYVSSIKWVFYLKNPEQKTRQLINVVTSSNQNCKWNCDTTCGTVTFAIFKKNISCITRPSVTDVRSNWDLDTWRSIIFFGIRRPPRSTPTYGSEERIWFLSLHKKEQCLVIKFNGLFPSFVIDLHLQAKEADTVLLPYSSFAFVHIFASYVSCSIVKYIILKRIFSISWSSLMDFSM